MPNGKSNLDKEGCEYGRHLKDKINNMEEIVSSVENSVKELSNHYSNRLPLWANLIGYVAFFIIGIMATIITAFIA